MAPTPSSQYAKMADLAYAISTWSSKINNITHPNITTRAPSTWPSSPSNFSGLPSTVDANAYNHQPIHPPSRANISCIPPKLLPPSRLSQTSQTPQSPPTPIDSRTKNENIAGIILAGITLLLASIALIGVWIWATRKLYTYLRQPDNNINWDTKWPMRAYTRPDQKLTRDCMKDYIIVALTFLLGITMPVWGPVYWGTTQLQKRKQYRAEKKAKDSDGATNEDDGECFDYAENTNSSSLYGKFARIAGLSRSENKSFTRSTKMMTLRERCRLESEMRRMNESRDLDEEAILGDDFMHVRAPITAHMDDREEEDEEVGQVAVSWSPIDYGEQKRAKDRGRTIVPITLAAIDDLTGTPGPKSEDNAKAVRAGFTSMFRPEPAQRFSNPYENSSLGSSGWSDCVSPRSSYEQSGLDHFAVGDDKDEDDDKKFKRK